MGRLDIERQHRLEPLRMEYCKSELNQIGAEIIYNSEKAICFNYNGIKVTLYPYSGWYTGKGVGSGRGFKALLEKLSSYDLSNPKENLEPMLLRLDLSEVRSNEALIINNNEYMIHIGENNFVGRAIIENELGWKIKNMGSGILLSCSEITSIHEVIYPRRTSKPEDNEIVRIRTNLGEIKNATYIKSEDMFLFENGEFVFSREIYYWFK